MYEEFLARPLPQTVVRDFCNRNLIPITLGDCTDPGLQLLARDVLPIFEANLVPSQSSLTDAIRLFGQYRGACDLHKCEFNVVSWPRIYVRFNTETEIITSIGQSRGGS